MLMRNCQQVSAADTFKRPFFARCQLQNLKSNNFSAYLVCIITKVNKKEKIFLNTIFDHSQLIPSYFRATLSDLAAFGIPWARTTNRTWHVGKEF